MTAPEACGVDPTLTAVPPTDEEGRFSIIDAALVSVRDMEHLLYVAENSRDSEYILQTVLEQTGVIPAASETLPERLKKQRNAGLAQISKAAKWYRTALFKDYADKKKGLNTDALDEVFDLATENASTSPILTILAELASKYGRDDIKEAERIAWIMILDEIQSQQ